MRLFAFKFLAIIALCCFDLAAQDSQPRLVPIAEGWAKNQVNGAIFRKNSVTSFNGNQFAAFYNGDSKVVLAQRKHGTKKWQIHQTRFSGNTADAHNSISLAVDGAGFLHLAWNNHGTALQYTRGLKPESLDMPDSLPMIGNAESKVTYPEFYSLPNGDLLFFYRDGASGRGNLVLNRYDLKTRKWNRLQNNLIDGENSRNAYPQTTVDAKGTIHVSWVWRESPDVATNHDLCYAKSSDGGRTWAKSSGEKYELPITAATAEYVWRIPQNSELINQTSMAADASGDLTSQHIGGPRTRRSRNIGWFISTEDRGDHRKFQIERQPLASAVREQNAFRSHDRKLLLIRRQEKREFLSFSETLNAPIAFRSRFVTTSKTTPARSRI